MSSAPHEVYARCLPGAHGYPLWTPELKIQLRESYQSDGLKIGDVGIISPNDGSFDVLFNITLPHSEQPYPHLVREGFAPIVLDPEADFASQPRAISAHGVISSESAELISHEVCTGSDQRPFRADYEFNLSMDDSAILILPEGAQSCDLVNEKRFLDEAIRHGIGWYACATERAGRLINNDSLYLVTGFHKTRSWSLGAAGRSRSSVQNRRFVKFKVEQIQQNNDPAAAYIWSATHGFTGRVGPLSEVPGHVLDGMAFRRANQTVFIRGFRITINKLLFLKTVSVETRQGTFGGLGSYVNNLLWGRPPDSTPSSGAENATDNMVEQDSLENSHGRLYTDSRLTIDRMQDVSQTFHPGDLINQYMLKKEPRAMIALTHDSLWIEMLRMGLLKLPDFTCEKRLDEVLSRSYRLIVEDVAVYLQKGLGSEYLSHQHCEQTSQAISQSNIPASSVSDPELSPVDGMQAEGKTLAPQHGLVPSSSAMRTDLSSERIITGIRVTNVALGHKRVPDGFYTVVRHSGLEWRTESKRLSANGNTIEWSGQIRIPSDLSATVCIEVYASLGSEFTLDAGERLRELTVTVKQLLDHSEKVDPFTFVPKDEDVSPRSSIFVGVTQGGGHGHDQDQASVIESIHTAEQYSVSRHTSDILEVMRLEREERAREREVFAVEREHERARLDDARQAHIVTLENELARTRAELDKERQLRLPKSNEPRMIAAKQDEGPSNQQVGPCDIFQPSHALRQEESAPIEEHWAEKQRREMEKLMGMISQLLDEQATIKQREEEQRQANEGRADIVKVIELLDVLSNNSTRQHRETIDAVRATANEQVPYNIQGYLDEFSKALAVEMRMLLGEVGKLREERRSIQSELGYLMTMKSKYGPGGEFDSEWKPSRMKPSAPPPPPPNVPPPLEDMPPARPSWRTVLQRSSRRSQKKREASPESIPESSRAHYWATWQPNPALAPTPPSVEPVLLVPDHGSPGLFGPRSPRGSYFDQSPLALEAPTPPLVEPTVLVSDGESPGLFSPRSPHESYSN